MGFLREQLGEDELRLLLERLNAFNNDDGPFDVQNLMTLSEVAAGDSEDPPDLQKKAAEEAISAILGDDVDSKNSAKQ